MPGRIFDIDGYPHSPDMAKAHRTVLKQTGLSLRQYIVDWRNEHPSEPLERLAAELGVHLSTMYRWFDKLRLGTGAPSIIDLDAA